MAWTEQIQQAVESWSHEGSPGGQIDLDLADSLWLGPQDRLTRITFQQHSQCPSCSRVWLLNLPINSPRTLVR